MGSKSRGSGGSGAQGGQSQNAFNNHSGGGGRDYRNRDAGQNNNQANQGRGWHDRFGRGKQNFRNGPRGRINKFRGTNFTKFKDSPANSFRDRKDADSRAYGNQHLCEFHKNNSEQFNDESRRDFAPQQSTEPVPESAPITTEIPVETMPSNPPNKGDIVLNIKTEKTMSNNDSKPKQSSSSSSSSSDSEDSLVKSLDKTVKQTIKKENPDGIEKPATEPAVKVKKEPNSENGKSSSSSSSSGDSSSSDEEVEKSKQVSEEDVICLGNVENIENLVDESPTITKCLLCDKIGHISFHCMMICKNCNGKYHGLKDCPKPANLSVVLSSFMEFCLKQSYKYNPNLGFTADTNEQYIAPTFLPPVSSCTTPSLSGMSNDHLKRKKSRSGTPRSIRKRLSTSSSTSSESDSEATKSRRRKHRKTSSKDQGGLQPFANVLPYPATFNQPFGFNQPGVVNPLLALSQMMGFNPAMGYTAHPAKE